jgi:hypothetical protein
MTTTQISRLILAMTLLWSCAWGQTDSAQSGATQSDTTQSGTNPSSSTQPSTAPAPAFGQSAPVLNPENPPISGLDEPALDLRTSSRSFFSPALQLSETADTNAGNAFGGSSVQSVTRFLGAFDLQKFFSKADVLAEYLGGGAVYSSDLSVRQMHAAGIEIIDRWRTGRISLRDSFSYLPEGSFVVATYGGIPGLGIATGSMGVGNLPGTQSFSNSSLGSIGLVPRLANSAILDVVQSITPRTAFTAAGGFSNAHFFDDSNQLVNSDQTTVQAGFSHLLNRHNQIAAIYGYQLFRFPQITGGQIENHIVNMRWSHTITGRLSLIAGAGPQYTIIQSNTAPDQKHWSVNGRAQLHYKWRHDDVVAGYEKYISAGSGFFAGADSQVARLSLKHPMGRTMDLFCDLGYSHNKRLENLGLFGSSGSTYDEGFAGAIVRKHFGRVYDLFVGYRFGEIGFDNASFLCGVPGFGACGNIAQRHAGTIGVEWHPTPIRIE